MDQLEAQEQSLRTTLGNLTREIQAAQNDSARYRAETEDQTKRLIEKRAQELKALETEAEKRLKELMEAADRYTASNRQLESAKTGLEDDLAGLKEQADSSRSALNELTAQLQRYYGDISECIESKTGLERQISSLNELIAPLKADFETLQRQVPGLIAKRDTLRTQLDDYRTEFETIRAEKERAVKVLQAQKSTLEAEIIEMRHNMDVEREELGRQIMAANERDEVLRRREAKLVRGEDAMRKNEQLMNL